MNHFTRFAQNLNETDYRCSMDILYIYYEIFKLGKSFRTRPGFEHGPPGYSPKALQLCYRDLQLMPVN